MFIVVVLDHFPIALPVGFEQVAHLRYRTITSVNRTTSVFVNANISLGVLDVAVLVGFFEVVGPNSDSDRGRLQQVQVATKVDV